MKKLRSPKSPKMPRAQQQRGSADSNGEEAGIDVCIDTPIDAGIDTLGGLLQFNG